MRIKQKPTKVKLNNFNGQYILHIHSPNGIVIKNEVKFIKALEDSYNTIFNEFSKHLNDLKKNKLVKPNNLVLVSVSGGIYCGGYCEGGLFPKNYQLESIAVDYPDSNFGKLAS